MNTTEIVIIAGIAICAAFLIAWKIYKQGLRKTAIDLIVEVEKNFKDNQMRFSTVVNGIIVRMPFPLNLIPVSIVENFVQKTFDEIKVALDYRKEN